MARKLIVELIAEASGYTRGLQTAAKATKMFGSEVDKATRGILSGSGAVEHLGRSIAFASGGFLAFASAGEAIRKSIDASKDAAVTQRQLAAQLATSGIAWDQVKGRIEDADLALSKVSGFNTDELEKSFTTLVRSSGSVSKALYVNTVAADVARGRNISLAQASVALAKAEAGHVTALQRLGIVLPKGAKGMEAIRIVAAKFAGQAEAGASASDRFAAALHNTEVTVGDQLLPTLNRLLTSTTDWLDKSQNQKRIADDVHQAVGLLTDAFNALKGALDAVNTITGSTKTTVELLFGAFVAFKTARFALMFGEIAAGIAGVGGASTAATAQARLLVGTLDVLAGPAGLIAATSLGLLYMEKSAIKAADAAQQAAAAPLNPGSGLETTLVPRLAKQIAQMKAAGQSDKTIIATLRDQLGGSLKADDLIAEAFTFGSGSDPKLQARIRQQVAAAAKTVVKTAQDTIDKTAKAGATVKQRNTWFDQMISRQLGRVQDITSIGDQITTLKTISNEISDRIAVTKDITRKLNLEDQLAGVQRQIRDAQQQQTDQLKQAHQTAVDNKLGWLQLKIDQAGLTASVGDNIAATDQYIAAIKQLIRKEGDSLTYEQDLLQARQSRQALVAQAQQTAQTSRENRQFAALGLGPGGAALVPTADALRRRLGRVEDAVTGTFLDTNKTSQLFARVQRVLSGNLGRLTDAVRSQIQQLLDSVDQQLSGQPAKTIAKAHGLNAILGLGPHGENVTTIYNRADYEALRRTWDPSTMGLLRFGRSSGIDYQQPARAAREPTIVINGGVHLHGVQNPRELQDAITKNARGRPVRRRGDP